MPEKKSASSFLDKLTSPISIYFILALGLTWLCWIPTLIISSQYDYFVPSTLTFHALLETGFVDTRHAITYIVFQLGVYGPMIAGFVVLSRTKGKAGIRDLLGRMRKWQIDSKWYGIIIGLPVLISFAAVGLGFLMGVDVSNLFDPRIPILLWPVFFLNIMLTSGLEEPGWRGYALPELQKTYTAEKSSYILGFFWGIWHFPFLIYLYVIQLDVGVFGTIFALVGYVALLIGGTFIATWIYNSTQSVFLMILYHSVQNFVPQLIMGGLTHPILGTFSAVVTWFIATILLTKFGGETLTSS